MSLADILEPLQQPLFTVLDTPVSWTEFLGFGSGALCVWLVARQHLANWPIGIANNLFVILPERPVRAALARRVVVLGAESTGTTTMARALAERYQRRGGVWANTRWVPECGREYSEQKLAAREQWPETQWEDVEFTSAEFPVIAERHPLGDSH